MVHRAAPAALAEDIPTRRDAEAVVYAMQQLGDVDIDDDIHWLFMSLQDDYLTANPEPFIIDNRPEPVPAPAPAISIATTGDLPF